MIKTRLTLYLCQFLYDKCNAHLRPAGMGKRKDAAVGMDTSNVRDLLPAIRSPNMKPSQLIIIFFSSYYLRSVLIVHNFVIGSFFLDTAALKIPGQISH
jgi:hypothetical protein